MNIELNNIYNCDCIDGMKLIPDNSIDCILTDPPYLIGYKTNSRHDKTHKFCHEIMHDRFCSDDKKMIHEYITGCYRILKENTAIYMFCSWKTIDFFKNECQQAGFHIKNVIVWKKNRCTMGDLRAQFGQSYECIIYANKGRCFFNGKRINDVWEFNAIHNHILLHSNQKPVDLLCQCINKSSQLGGVIFDGFMGSGSTAIAALHTGRSFIGFELDKYYYDICLKRIQSYQIDNCESLS